MAETPTRGPFGIWLDQTLRTLCSPVTGRYLAQHEVARAVGVTQAAIHHMISGRRRPAADVVIRLANYLGENVNDLLQLAGYEPIRDSLGLADSDDPATLRIVAAVGALQGDKRRLAIAAAVREAVLEAEREHGEVDTAGKGSRAAQGSRAGRSGADRGVLRLW